MIESFLVTLDWAKILSQKFGNLSAEDNNPHDTQIVLL
ncbi:hypothetical protein CEV32_3686 [Brucella rhizosphaerae]|uniref:Uncharacterized protein n=1 Tax=Brucella rhizosphaerae TaxID=571254 RepID=A0A256FSP4_9HYPH|nr:hypothetical protein CEV32_3686 [Brucella rhizosphaerae]